LRSVSRLVRWQLLFPARRKFARDAAAELGVLGGELFAIPGKSGGPLLLEVRATLADLSPCGIDLLGNVERLVGKAGLALELGNVVSFQG
jgi:hypothetical protein